MAGGGLRIRWSVLVARECEKGVYWPWEEDWDGVREWINLSASLSACVSAFVVGMYIGWLFSRK